MGTLQGDNLITELSRKVRDTANAGYTRVLVLDVLNRAQRSINARLGLVHSTAAFTTTNSPIYDIPTIAADVVRVIAVRDNNRELDQVMWHDLVHQDRKWYRLRGPRALAFSTIGRELLVVIPAPQIATSLTAVYVQQTANMDDGAVTPLAIPDEYKPILLDLGEAILMFKAREFKSMEEALKRAAVALGIDGLLQRSRRGSVGHG
jgi:hypothetical protein